MQLTLIFLCNKFYLVRGEQFEKMNSKHLIVHLFIPRRNNDR